MSSHHAPCTMPASQPASHQPPHHPTQPSPPPACLHHGAKPQGGELFLTVAFGEKYGCFGGKDTGQKHRANRTFFLRPPGL